MGKRERARARQLKRARKKSSSSSSSSSSLKHKKAPAAEAAAAAFRRFHFGNAVQYPSPLSLLIVGDGDFSFARGVVVSRGGRGGEVVATSLDSRSVVLDKYRRAGENLEVLARAGAGIYHGVDCTKLAGWVRRELLIKKAKNNDGKGNNNSETADNLESSSSPMLASSPSCGSSSGHFDRIIFNFPHSKYTFFWLLFLFKKKKQKASYKCHT